MKKHLLFLAVGCAMIPVAAVSLIIGAVHQLGKSTCEAAVRSWSASL